MVVDTVVLLASRLSAFLCTKPNFVTIVSFSSCTALQLVMDLDSIMIPVHSSPPLAPNVIKLKFRSPSARSMYCSWTIRATSWTM